jgi:hypothetical protein
MCVTLLGRPYEKKYVKGDVSIRDSFKKNVSQIGLGSHRPHGTRAGLKENARSHANYRSQAFNAANPKARFWTKFSHFAIYLSSSKNVRFSTHNPNAYYPQTFPYTHHHP